MSTDDSERRSEHEESNHADGFGLFGGGRHSTPDDPAHDEYDSSRYDETGDYDETGHYEDGDHGASDVDHGYEADPSDGDYERADNGPRLSRAQRGAQRSDARRSAARRRRRRLIPLIAFLVVVVLATAGFFVVRASVGGFGGSAKDYTGTGTGEVVVQVHAGDASGEIAQTLVDKGVVASRQAFINAAKDSGHSQDFQPGYFKLHSKMSAASAVALLLDDSSRLSTRVTITEGMTVAAVLQLLSTKLNLKLADLQTASKDLGNLGIPAGFNPTSAEGFLTPQTYDFDPGTNASEALQQLTSQFQSETRTLNFAAGAQSVGLSQYQALIVASLVEGESFFDEDRAKVARVVYNRLAAKMPLGFDSTSAYGAKLIGQDPKTIDYTKNTPYNTRNLPGLPPTPINNPGEKAMKAALAPASGNWLYFVNQDKAGHLFFTNDYNAFVAAAQKCAQQGWGCDPQK